jgi:hypothetical protein
MGTDGVFISDSLTAAILLDGYKASPPSAVTI